MVGTIGNLQPDKPEFKEYLDRYHKNRLFLGIRYGNIWGYSLVAQVSSPAFIEGLKLLQQADLILETANPQPDLIESVLRVTDKVPSLRVVIDHLPAMLRSLDDSAMKVMDVNLRELAQRPQVFVKVSEVLRLVDGKPSADPKLYRSVLDPCFGTFGENQVIFGSDWPHGPAVDNLPTIVKIVQDYFSTRSHAAAEKYFWRNSVVAYKWIRRDPSQPLSTEVA
jgi:L-fuconolactonase